MIPRYSGAAATLPSLHLSLLPIELVSGLFHTLSMRLFSRVLGVLEILVRCPTPILPRCYSYSKGLLIGSRVLYGLACKNQAPRFFKRVNRWGVPYLTVLFYGAFMTLGYMTLGDTAATVFTWLQDLVASAQLFSWMIICITYLRFYYALKKQGISRQELPWAAPFQPYAAWITLIALLIIFLTGGYTTFIHHQ
jgi:amino acid permease